MNKLFLLVFTTVSFLSLQSPIFCDSAIISAHIPAGKAMIGAVSSGNPTNELPAKTVDLAAFSIGIYEVTNAQYSTWLNDAIKNGKVVYVAEADQRGQVMDMQGYLIFKTFEADPYSQIFIHQRSIGAPQFLPVAGKDNYPVVNVSWRGAVAYCQDNQCRLPTEAEWEKAAGMEPEVLGKPLKKYLYGFGSDQIDRTFANYKISDSPIQNFQVATTPVGFYNGVNLLPLNLNHSEQQRTHLAKSPYGAFDMSGNVWEWVADWYDAGYIANMSDTNPQGPLSGYSKVVKGGCYDSLAEGVRVTERLGLPLEYADAYTGFRVAKDN
ncbi:MAG: formylglycine-generating enzyme family protein [Parachlamydiaceae bacterium]